MAIFEINYGFNDFTCGEYIYAITTGDTDQVKALLETGQDPFERDSGGNTPYFWASFQGDVVMIQAIAEAQVKRGGIQGLEPWHVKMAIPMLRPLDSAQMDRFKLLYSLVPDRSALKSASPEFLSEAVFHGADVEVVRFLLLAGAAPIHRRKPTGNTPLHDACVTGRADVLELLMGATSDLNIKNDSGETPLRVAVNAVLGSGLQEARKCCTLLEKHKTLSIPPLRIGERFSLWKMR